MIVGICEIELHIWNSLSLKDKRRVMNRIKDKIRNSFNVAVAEIGDDNVWQRARLGIACVGGEQKWVERIVNGVRELLQKEPDVEVINFWIEWR